MAILSSCNLWFKCLHILGNSLAVQWLGLYTCTAGGLGLIPGQGTRISKPHDIEIKNKELLIQMFACNISSA